MLFPPARPLARRSPPSSSRCGGHTPAWAPAGAGLAPSPHHTPSHLQVWLAPAMQCPGLHQGANRLLRQQQHSRRSACAATRCRSSSRALLPRCRAAAAAGLSSAGRLCHRHPHQQLQAAPWPPLPGRPSQQQQQRGATAQPRQRSVAARAIAGTLSATGIIPLGYDFLTFLATTVMVVPACKYLKLSPMLGFLFAGVALEQAGCVGRLVRLVGVCVCVCLAATAGSWLHTPHH